MKTPFSVSPMPSALYLTPSLQAAINKINYVVNNRQGMALLLGEPGTGKTSVLRRVYGDLDASDDTTVALLPQLQARSLMAFTSAITNAFKLPPRASLLKQTKELQDFCFAEAGQGRNVVLLLDEAQGSEKQPQLFFLLTLTLLL